MFRRCVVQRRQHWEYEPSAEHRSLVLMLYRCIMKELVDFQSVRRRSLIAHARLTFRRRAVATEKLLIDECVEEARRAVYVLTKHNNLKTTGSYEFDSMFLPKDTGQDVGRYMEEIYDPAVGKKQYASVSDVVPGKEHLHTAQAQERAKGIRPNFESPLREEDKQFRPPKPPME